MEKNSFTELQQALEAQFETGPNLDNLLRVEQQVQTMHVFGQLAELFIPIAAGAAVTMTTGAEVKSAQAQTAMPDFAWRYKTPNTKTIQSSNARDRFQPFIPF